MPSTILNKKRVAILEDDPSNRERWTSLVTMCGAVAVPVSAPAPALSKLGKFLAKENISLVMCDNRLFERDYAHYYGAEAVAESYRSGRGGVLVTDYESDDADLSIREHRQWIPVLVHATGLERGVLESALLQADREVREKSPTRERVPHRTVMTVRQIIQKGAKKVVKVVMSQWNPHLEVGFPLNIVPPRLRATVTPGKMLIAQVNIEAARAEDLFFIKFELPDPNALKKAKTLFGRS